LDLEFPAPVEFVRYLENEGIERLYPLQIEGMKILSRGESLLLATPTSSGKTVVAYYGILRAWKMGLRSLYVVPLRALAEEKYEDLKFFDELGLKVGISTGDYDRPSNYLKNYDIIISTSEKVDSLLRNNPSVFDNLGFVVFDEIHNILDESRGSTLEIVISKIRFLVEGAQFIAMSATVKNVNDIARWLNSIEVTSDFRPVPLRKFVVTSDSIIDEDGLLVSGIDSFEDFVTDSLENSGQTLIFVRSRKSAETTAEKLGRFIETKLTLGEKEELEKISYDSDSPGYDKLLPVLKRGVGYHHAGMLSEQRRLVERLFKERKLKVIVATTTLAAGLNLPARSVIIKDIFRYDGFSSVMIPNLEVQQMLGRAGRVKFDRLGNGYIYTSRNRLQDVFSAYVNGELESITSRINESKIRMHVLGLISSGMSKDVESLNKFFSTTLAFHEGLQLDKWIEASLQFLQDNEMIKGTGTYKATPFGRKVSELYIDPLTGVILKNTVPLHDVDEILLGICSTPDMPPLYVSDSESSPYIPPSNLPFHSEPEQMKVASILGDWIEEFPEDAIIEKYHIWPADLRNRVEIADWLSHSLYEISRALNLGRTELRILNYRISNGIQQDLIPLVFLPNVGRVRARRLMVNGFNLEKIANSTVKDLEKIQGFGERISESIIREARKLVDKQVTHGL
jgi:helicase